MSMSRYIVVAAVKCRFDHHSIDGHAFAGGTCGMVFLSFVLVGKAGREAFTEPFNGETPGRMFVRALGPVYIAGYGGIHKEANI
jgi:hypothetical protein